MGSETRARLGVAALLVATLFSFELLFEGDGYAGPALFGALIATGVCALARRWGAGSILMTEISLAALFWFLTIVFQASQTFYGIPTPAAASGLAELVSDAYEASQVDYAPVPMRAGYVVMVVAGMWIAATFAELATFRWRRPILASLPCIALFAVNLVVGSGQGTLPLLVVFLIALLVYWAVESSYRLQSWGRWVSAWDTRAQGQPPGITGALARKMGATCVIVTLAAPLLLPSVNDSWLPWRNDTGEGPGSGSGGGGSVNLLVDIAPRLIEQSDDQFFEVTVDENADDVSYWRLGSLSEFDGQTWKQADVERDPKEGPIAGTPSIDGDAVTPVTQTFRLTGLEGEFLPAAVEPESVEGVTAEVDAESIDLKVPDGIDSDEEYTVTSQVPTPTFKELREAQATGFRVSGYSKVPDLSPEVGRIRERLTEDLESDFEKLIAIQNFLRGPDFTYSTEDVEAPADMDHLTAFLTRTRTGFCQQFAGAFAILARDLGFPTRISVGFLPGSLTPTADGATFTVRGSDAHAWPEVYFDGYGWVAFEPTPRQGQASMPAYTIPDSVPTIFREGETGRQASGRAGPGPDGRGLEARERRVADPGGRGGADAERERGPAPEPPWRDSFGRLALTACLIALLWAIAVPLAKLLRARRRYARSPDPAGLTLAAWAQFEDDASELWEPRSPAESPSAYMRRLAASGRAPARAAERFAELCEAAAYSPGGVAPNQAAEARRQTGRLSSSLWSSASLWKKGARLFSVRSLLRDRPRPGPRRLRLRPAA